MIPVRRLAMAGALSLACCAVQQSPAVTVRYEAESTGVVKDKNDAVGYDSINGIVGRAVDPPASNNELLYTLGTDRTIKVVFAGTGINFVAPITHDGSAFTWQLDEGAQSGSSTTLGICCTSQVPIPIISGLPSGLHTLEIEKANLTDFVLRMDAFDVIDNVERTRFEQDSPQVTLSADQWVLHDTGGDAAAEASGGSVAYTGFEGATATLDFVGTGVAAIVVARGDGQLFDFSIDNGLRTGSIDLRAANQLGAGNLHR